jgi:YfaZ precursor
MLYKKIILTTLFSTSLMLAQNSAGVNINDEDLEIEASMDLTQYTDGSNGTTYILGANYINTELNDDLLSVGINANNTFQGMEGFNVSLGVNVILLDDFISVPLMGEISYSLPLVESIPTITLSTQMLYAPSVLSFDEADKYFEFRGEASMEVISAVSVYLGYRDIETTYLNAPKNTFNDTLYGGVKVGF